MKVIAFCKERVRGGGDLGVRHQFRLQATGYQRSNILFRGRRLTRTGARFAVMTDDEPRPRANHFFADMIDADP